MTVPSPLLLTAAMVLLLSGLPGLGGAQKRPQGAERAAAGTARTLDSARAKIDARLSRAPKRKKPLALTAAKDDRSRSDAATVPAGRPPLPAMRARSPKR